MKATIYISNKITRGETLKDVIRQYKSFDDPTELLVVLDSIGGSVDEGDDIYAYLQELKSKHTVNTYAKKAYSIAAKIFTVGENRMVEDVDKALMIHNPWGQAEGQAKDFEAIAEELRKIEKEFAEFYSSFLSIDQNTVSSLLESQTFISGKDAVSFEFATELKVPVEAVAEYNININNNKMTEKSKQKSKGQKLLEAMAEFVGIELKTKEVEINAQLTLQDSNGSEIVFPDLDSEATPAVGDAATMDGNAIPDGSYVMPSLDEATVVFVDGKISEIIPKEDENPPADVEASKKETPNKKEVKAEEIKEVSVWSVEVTNTSFEIGETVMYAYDGQDYPVGAGEFRLSDGTKIVTDASGVIVSKEASTEANPPVETEASFNELLSKVTEKVKTEIKAELEKDFNAKIAEKEDEIKSLKEDRKQRNKRRRKRS